MAYIKRIQTGGGGGGGYDTIQEEGAPLPQESALNFIGSAATATDDAGNSRTNVTFNSKLNQIASSTLSKGMLYTSDGSAITVLTVGTNDAYLVADSTQANGIRWESAYNTVEEETAPLPQRAVLNFEGSAVTAVDDAGNNRTNVVVNDNVNNLADITFATGDTLYYNGTALVKLAIGTSNQVLTVTGGAPVWANSTGGGITWQAVTTNTTLVKANGYFSNNTNVIFTLPATAAVGDTFRISNIGTGFTVAQNASQSIRLGNVVSTTGTGGSVVSTTLGDSIEIVCSVANTEFQIVSSIGELTLN